MWFDSFPYFDYQDINLDWLIARMREFLIEFGTLEGNFEAFKKYVETYLENIEVSEEVSNILNDWFEDGKIQELLLAYNTTVLTSNDIDVQNLYTYVLDDNRTISGGSPAYPVFQGMAITEGGNFLTVSNDEFTTSNQGLVREINSSGNFTGREALVELGHANGCCYGNGKLYIAWQNTNPDNIRSGKITILNYASFTVEAIKDIGVDIRAIAYNKDTDEIIAVGFQDGTNIPIYFLDNNLSGIIRQNIIVKESWMNLNQDVFYYNNQICFIGSYPNVMAFYNLDTLELVKVYNPDQRAGIGVPFNEIESGDFYNGDFYVCSFSRLDETNSYNNIAKINPWKNVYSGYAKHNRFNGQLELYVDGENRSPVQDGTEEHPFGHIMLAVAVNSSKTKITTPSLTIRCKDGTNVGCLSMLGFHNVVVNSYSGNNNNPYTLHGCRLATCTNIFIRNGKITYNKNASTGSANLYSINSMAQLENVTFDGVNGDENTSANKIALFGGLGSKLQTINVNIDNNFDTGVQLNGRSEMYRSGGSNTATRPNALYEDARLKSPTTVKPIADYWSRKAEAATLAQVSNSNLSALQSYNLNYDTNLEAFEGFNFAVVNTALGGRNETHFLKVGSGSTNFQLTTSHTFTGFWVGVIEGSIDMNTKTITLTQISVYNTHTQTLYKLSDGAVPGIAYPVITGIYLF